MKGYLRVTYYNLSYGTPKTELKRSFKQNILSLTSGRARKLFNKARRIGQWDVYRTFRTELHSYKPKLLPLGSKENSNGIGLMIKSNGECTCSNEETVKLRLLAEFPIVEDCIREWEVE